MAHYDRDAMAADAAKAKGCVVVYPKPNELFIDIDSDNDFEVFLENLSVLKQYLHADTIAYARTPSPSGRPGRWHLVVTLPRDVASATERIVLQATLGSDRKRELLSLLRVSRGDAHPTAFFERPAF